jgi:hypothetical protein
MARQSLDEILAGCNATTRALNRGLFPAGRILSVPEPEPALRNGIPPAPRCETRFAARVLVRVKSFRCQPADPDNIVIKWMVDCLRYSRVIGNDRKEDIEIKIDQERVRSRKDERTEIVVELVSTTAPGNP